MKNFYHTSQDTPDAEVVLKTAHALLDQGVAVIPTDSVYGIACCVSDDTTAYRRIYSIKNRPEDMKLPWLISDLDQLDLWGFDIPPIAHRLAERFWPGAMTLVVKASDKVSDAHKAEDGSVALRIPNSNFVRDVIRFMDKPIAATSANLHGFPSAVSGSDLDPKLLERVDIVVDAGVSPVAIESTIVDCTKTTPIIVRHGALSAPILEVINSERSN